MTELRGFVCEEDSDSRITYPGKIMVIVFHTTAIWVHTLFCCHIIQVFVSCTQFRQWIPNQSDKLDQIFLKLGIIIPGISLNKVLCFF